MSDQPLRELAKKAGKMIHVIFLITTNNSYGSIEFLNFDIIYLTAIYNYGYKIEK
jgi:hypothetical protein